MTADGTLRIVEHLSDGPEENVFAIHPSLQNVPASEYEAIFRQISEADIPTATDLPLYGVIRIHFAFLFAQNNHPPMAIPHLIVLYRLLDEHLTDHEYDAVQCEELPPNYQAVVTDVAAKHDIPVRGTERFGFHRTILGLLAGLWRYLLLVLSQSVALLWKHVRHEPAPTKTVFVPHINRFDSTRSVLDGLDAPHEVILPTPTVTWLRHRNNQYATIREYDPTPLDYFATPWTMLDSLGRGARLATEVLVQRTFDRRLQRFLDTEFGVEMPNTVTYLLGNLFTVHVPSLANTVLAERMIAELTPENLVVGSLGSRQQAILYPAIRAGVNTYHVPHSATTGYELAPPPETVHFVPGEHVVDHLRESEQMSSVDNLAPTGRPQLVDVSERAVTPRNDSSAESLRIVVATQPFPDQIRERFISDVLGALEAVPEPIDVVVKIHPNENAVFYDAYTADRPYPVTVAETDLHGYLAGADLTITINSNVGLESMVLGTPVVCVNEWEPLIRARPYATLGPVPVLETKNDLGRFFAGFDGDRLDELTTAERGFVDESYLHCDAASEIARIVESDAHLPDSPRPPERNQQLEDE